MTQVLKGLFGVHRQPSRSKDRAESFAPDLTGRYRLDNNGRRVLAGLTVAETREFEMLDSLSPSDDNGNRIAWTFGGEPTTGREKRWLTLYARHDEAWKALKAERSRR